jgi:tRNA nucleotidyltransferase/poly(A) polymerase
VTLLAALTSRFPALRKLPPGCYVVGGAVRDLLLQREPLDVDVAAPDAAAAAVVVRAKVIRLGKEELTAYRVVKGDRVYDFANLEGGSIEPDLARRDFTVNAMAVELVTGALLDPHGGQGDLTAGVVRMVRASNFDDDPLRTLKGVRMAVRYGFTIEPATAEAIRSRAGSILSVAPERVTAELAMIFSARAFRRALALLGDLGFAAPLELAVPAVHADDVSLAGALASVIGDARAYAERWRWSDSLLRDVLTLQRLIEQHDRMALYDAGESLASQLPAVLRALGRDDTLDLPDFTIRPLLTGNEIAALTGLAPGPELGRTKRALLEAQVRGEVRTREDAERLWLYKSGG